MSKTYKIIDIPESELKEQIQILEQDGAIEVNSEKQENGKFTILAEFPDN